MSQPLLRDPIVSSSITRTGSGNGTVSVDKLTHFTTAQVYTLTCIAKSPDTIFSVSGSIDGPVGIATVGVQFFDDDLKIFLTITQGSTAFEVGDQFVFSVANGTDLHQDNIDLYDELPQKNFGAGLKGSLKGDHNLKFSSQAVAANLFLQDLKFTSTIVGAAGNNDQVQYAAPVPGVAASGSLQGLTFAAKSAGAAGNLINVALTQSVTPVKSAVTIQNVNFQAQNAGTSGNSLSIQYTTGAVAGFEIVTVIGNAVTIQISSGSSTPANIVTAVNANSAAYALLVAKAAPLTSTTAQTGPVAQTLLTGGLNGSGNAGFEVVTVIGNTIQVQCQNNVSTIAQVKSALDASSAAFVLITTTLTQAGTTVVVSPAGPSFLAGGADKYGYAGFEKVTVTGSTAVVYMESGASTANAIKTAWDANSQATALAACSITGDPLALQIGPVAATNLHGGLAKFYSFNHNEITDGANFFEGNASVKVQDQIVQGEQTVNNHATFNDAVSLSASSSPKIVDAQAAINALIQRGKLVLSTVSNTPVLYAGGTLQFNSDLKFTFTDSGVVNTLLSSASPFTITDGLSLYVNLNPSQTQNISSYVVALLPTSAQSFRLVTRTGNYLTWFNGAKQKDQDLVRVGGTTDYRDQVLSLLADGGIVSHSATVVGLISWDAPIHVRQLGTSAEISILAGSAQLNDGDVAYIQLDDPFTTATKTMFSSPRTTAELARTDRYWIFYRSGGKVYVRGGGTLVQGEERTIGEPISNDVFTFMGSQGETDSAPSFTTLGHTTTATANRFVTDGDSLTKAIKELDTEIGAHEDNASVHGVGAGNVVVGTGTQQVLTNKDIDGGTASNANRITVPKNTASNLNALTRKQATIVYDTDSNRVLIDDGTTLKPVGSGGSILISAYDPVATTLPVSTAYLIDGQTITNGMLVVFDALTSGSNKIYRANVISTTVSWAAQSLFSTGSSPVAGDAVRVSAGSSFGLAQGVFDGSTFKFNNFVRYFNGTDYYEQSALVSVAIAASTTAQILSVAYAGSENMILDFSILRGTAKEVGTLHVTTDGVKASVSQSGTATGLTGIQFAAAIVGINLVISYTSDSAGMGTIKFMARRWANASGGTAGIPSYGSVAAPTSPAAGSNGQIQFNGAGVLAGDSGLTYDPTLKVFKLGGLEITGLKTFVLPDNNYTTGTIFNYVATDYPFVIIEYSIKRDSAYRVGRLLIANNGSQISMTDDSTSVNETGVTLLAGYVAGTVALQFFTTNTGFNAQFKYSFRRWS